MIGTQIGDLTLIRMIGEGGMGTIYLARHVHLNDLQAVKILDPRFTGNPQIVTRFLNEGRAAVKLRHPNLIAVHDIGQLPGDGPWYMVMEYLDGATLARFLASQGGPVPVHLIVQILSQILGCMKWIHDNGVVHRDLKPENVMLVARGDDRYFPKVLDLGVAQLSDAIAAGPGTKTGTLIGTPVYMAPEQLRGERVTALADIFALGVIAYEMSTGGWFPWQRDDEPRSAYLQLHVTELYHRQCSIAPVDPRRRVAGLGEGWGHALLRVIAPDPHHRPQSDRELALLLAKQVPSDGIHPGGVSILQQRAKDLLQPNDVIEIEMLRASRPPVEPKPALPGNKLRYQVGAKLGAGGMAEVFEGMLLGAEGFARRVAIKRVLAGLSEVPAFVTLFVAEAQTTSRLSHTNVVSVIDFDRDADGRLCLVMEYVHGKDLARLLATGPLAPSLILYITIEMLRGLGYAHAPEPGRDAIVHRDVSPHNLLLSYEGDVKVSDFGLARARDASGEAQSGPVRGKPSYMSPEQCNGEPLDARSDLFAVGVMLWEMATGRSLFTGTPKEILSRVLFQKVPPPSTVRGGVPPDLEAITMKLLAHQRDARYPNAEAVITELLHCQDVPRDGRGELVRLMAERFPDGATRTRIPGTGVPGNASNLQAMPVGVSTVSDVSVSAGSQPVQPEWPMPPMRPTRRWSRIVGLGFAVLVTGMVALWAVVRGPATGIAVPHERPGTITNNASTRGHGLPDAAVVPDAVPPDAAMTDVRTTTQVVVASPRDAGVDVRVSSQRPPQVAVAKGAGELMIIVKPWALIWLNGKPAGQTPYREAVPADRYRVRIQNDDMGRDETIMVTITPGQTTTIERKW